MQKPDTFYTVDCKWGLWSAWSLCDAVCGEGLKNRSRLIKQSALWNGKKCNQKDGTEVTACFAGKCTTPTSTTSATTTTTRPDP